VAVQADPDAYLEFVRKAVVATAELISADLSAGR
jgi:IclR family transcriptional regulator, pca regulon regulatory protein